MDPREALGDRTTDALERLNAGPERIDERPRELVELGVEGAALKAVGRRETVEEVHHGAA